mmetsp:Transcript_24978/g.58955  ORF Transcript_24978/g.58955 Transcript_24978/m.58955 type:complete len:635 (+) Transcript_24978:263-2167(+)
MTNSLTASPNSSASPRSAATMKDRRDETKELDSPRTTSTSSACSYDEHSIDTPPPMHERLGRIIISSGASGNSSSDSTRTPTCCSISSSISTSTSSIISNSEHNHNSARYDGIPTNSLRHRSVRRGNNHSELHHVPKVSPTTLGTNKKDDPSDILLSALNQLNRLATLDSAEYQQRLLENSLPALQAEPTNSLYCPSLSGSKDNTATQIGPLSQPLQTPLVQLSMSIHRLHAVIANVTREIDGHTDEVQELRSELEALRHRNRRLEKAAKQVHKQNLKLKTQSRHDRKVAKSLQHKVHKYEAQLESQGFQLMASKVQQHEIQLQLIKSQKGKDAGSTGGNSVGNAELSDYCDIENEIQDVGITSVGSDLSETTTESADKQGAEFAIAASCRTDVSKSRSGFDGTLPTLRFSVEGCGENDASTKSSCREAERQDAPPLPSDVADQCDEKSTAHEDTPTVQNTPTSLSSRFAKFLGHRVLSNYNLKMEPPCNLQFAELGVESSRQDNVKEKQQSQSAESTDVEKDTSFGSVENNRSDQPKKKAPIFAVCGFDGFNAEINMKPTLGARLVKINGQSMSDDWTLEKLCNEMAGNNANANSSGKSTKSKPIVLTFRNETWDRAQSEELTKAIRQRSSKE